MYAAATALVRRLAHGPRESCDNGHENAYELL
jgi:hypothetical protein